MATIRESIEISRPPGEVFSYATDFEQFSRWQQRVVSARQHRDGPLAVGSTAAVIRRVGPRQVATTEQITALDPPTTWQVRGSGNIPVTATATGTITPRDAGSRSLVTIAWSSTAAGSAKSSPR